MLSPMERTAPIGRSEVSRPTTPKRVSRGRGVERPPRRHEQVRPLASAFVDRELGSSLLDSRGSGSALVDRWAGAVACAFVGRQPAAGRVLATNAIARSQRTPLPIAAQKRSRHGRGPTGVEQPRRSCPQRPATRRKARLCGRSSPARRAACDRIETAILPSVGARRSSLSSSRKREKIAPRPPVGAHSVRSSPLGEALQEPSSDVVWMTSWTSDDQAGAIV